MRFISASSIRRSSSGLPSFQSVALGDLLSAVDRFLRDESERLSTRIANVSFDRERHASRGSTLHGVMLRQAQGDNGRLGLMTMAV